MQGDDRMNTASREEHIYEIEYINSWLSRIRLHPDTVYWIPPVQIFRHPTILEGTWGWDRLLPHLYVSIPMYLEYLTEYHKRNRLFYVADAAGNSKPEDWPLEYGAVGNDPQLDPNASLVDAAQFCLDTEKRFMLAWNNKRVRNVKHLSLTIQEQAGVIISTSEEFSETVAASLVCIANEAVLATELLVRGAKSTDEEIRLCNLIRHCALNFMHMEGPESAASIAAMVGVAKEARRMYKWMREKNKLYVFHSYYPPHEMHPCDVIREAAFKVMSHVLTKSSRGNNTYRVMHFEKKNKKPKANVRYLDEHEPVYEQAPLDEREKYIVELERKLSERDRELDALKFGHKKDLIGEQTNELAKASSVCDNSEAERAEHQQIHYIKECLQEKEHELFALKEQYKVAQEKLRRAHSLIAQNGEKQSQALEAELRECTEQFDSCHTTLQQQSVEQARRDLSNVFTESRTGNKLYNIAAELKSNIVNQADTLRSASIPKEPTILDERPLLTSIVRAISACPNSRISTNSALQLLGLLGPLDWNVYENLYGKLHDFLASHPEFFVIDGDFVQLRGSEGVQQFVPDATTAASSSAPCSS